MLRWTKWVTPAAALILMAAFQAGQARADDPTTGPVMDGKATIKVTVVDADGKPVPDATVGLGVPPAKKPKGNTTQPDTGTPPKRMPPLESATTGADGTCELTKVPNGDYVVQARAKKLGNGRQRVTIVDDKDGEVSITLKPRPAKN